MKKEKSQQIQHATKKPMGQEGKQKRNLKIPQ